MSGGGGHGGKKGHKHEEHEEHEEHVNHEAWVIPYADMLTLLMALFLVLFAIGRTDLEKFKKLAESFREEFGGGASSQVVTISEGQTGTSPLDGGEGVLDANVMPANAEGTGNGDGTGMATPTELQIEQARQEAEQEAAQEALGALESVEDAIQAAADAQGVGDQLVVQVRRRGTRAERRRLGAVVRQRQCRAEAERSGGAADHRAGAPEDPERDQDRGPHRQRR